MAQHELSFEKMTETDYAAFMKVNLDEYADERARNLRHSVETELEAAKKQTSELLPKGQETDGHFFYNVIDVKNGETVGKLWLNVDRTTQMAFVFYVRVEEKCRGQGYGKQIMGLLEQHCRKLGLKQIGLHVFNDNAVAQSLYRQQGYYTVGMNMQKDL